jgi:hypothetical protein
MAKGAAKKEPIVKKVSAKDAKRVQDKDDLATLELNASQPVSFLVNPLT